MMQASLFFFYIPTRRMLLCVACSFAGILASITKDRCYYVNQ